MMAICSHDHCCPPLPLLSYNSAHLSLVSTVVSFGHQFVNNDSHSFEKKKKQVPAPWAACLRSFQPQVAQKVATMIRVHPI
jgi:hypothetical protein